MYSSGVIAEDGFEADRKIADIRRMPGRASPRIWGIRLFSSF
jgi:hypothetical protein